MMRLVIPVILEMFHWHCAKEHGLPDDISDGNVIELPSSTSTNEVFQSEDNISSREYRRDQTAERRPDRRRNVDESTQVEDEKNVQRQQNDVQRHQHTFHWNINVTAPNMRIAATQVPII